MIINIVDKNTDAIVDFIETDTSDSPPIWDDVFLERVNNGTIRYDFATRADTSEHLINKNKLVIQHPHGHYIALVIEDVEQTTEREVYIKSEGEHMRLGTARIIPPQKLSGATINSAAAYVLNGTRWEIGVTEFAGAIDFKIEEWINPLRGCITIGNQFDVEVRFRTEVSGGRISGRYVDFIKRIGEDDGGETVLGKDLIGIKRKENSGEVYTAMVGVGQSSTPGEYVTFESINGGKNYIEDKAALQRWSDDGQHLFGLWLVEPAEGEETVSPEMVKFRTEQAFVDNITSKLDYEVDSIALEMFGMDTESIRLGNTRRIKDEEFNPPLYLEARVKEIERRDLMTDVRAVYGNYREIQPNVYSQLKKLQMKLFNNETRWSQEGLKIISQATPPTDLTVIWAKPTTVNGTQLEVFHKYNGATWVPTASQDAGAIMYGDNRSLESQQGKLFPANVDGGLAVSSTGSKLIARTNASDRTLLSIDDTVATMFDGNQFNPKVVAHGKHYTQRIPLFIPSGTYNTGSFISTIVELKDFTNVAISNVSIIKTQSLAKEFYAYEELNGRVYNGGDLKSFVLRVSPNYNYTAATGETISIDIMIVGWR